jgi:diguanylate cyclase (GGDEF)-like protein/PAS domain S-box-containing protein
VSIVILAAMVAAAVVSREKVDTHRRAQVLAEQVRASSQEMSAFKWRANTQVLNGTANLSLSGPIVGDGIKITSQLTNQVTQLAKLVPGADTRQLSHDVQSMVSASIDGLSQASGVDPHSRAQVAQLDAEFQPILDRLDADAARVAQQQQTVAKQALLSLQWVWIGSLLLGVCLLGGLWWRVASLRRRAALDQEVRDAERRSEERVRELVEHSSDVVTLLDRDLRVRWQGASVATLLGIEPGTLIDTSIVATVHPDDQGLFETFLRASIGGTAAATIRTRLRHADGRWIPVEIVAADRSANPSIGGIVLNMRDVSDQVAFEAELRHQAFFDGLTGLANRALFEDRLRHALAAGLRSQRPLAVLFLDLDDFKTINDSLGHAVGDQLLQRVAMRIDPLVRPADTAARLGGDEFAILLDGVDDVDEANEIAARLLAALADPIEIDQRHLSVTGSVGIALSDGSIDADGLLRNADTAMYAAKAAGKNAIRQFEPEMYQSAIERLELRSELARAIERDELSLEYQPIVSLDAERIVGLEALVRWEHPSKGRLYPGSFIALAEETGLIVPIGRWVLEHACAQVHEWHRALGDRPLPYISVNVSVRQLDDDAFPAWVAQVLDATGLSPDALVLEITEGLLAHDRDAIIRRLQAFKELGIRIAVDDFGTGYSALSHLQHFPVDILKIDKSFIDELHTNSQTATLVQGIINLGETLALDVVAEGVEKPQQADRLKAMRSPLGQGFLFARPTDPARILELLRDPSRVA